MIKIQISSGIKSLISANLTPNRTLRYIGGKKGEKIFEFIVKLYFYK